MNAWIAAHPYWTTLICWVPLVLLILVFNHGSHKDDADDDSQ